MTHKIVPLTARRTRTASSSFPYQAYIRPVQSMRPSSESILCLGSSSTLPLFVIKFSVIDRAAVHIPLMLVPVPRNGPVAAKRPPAAFSVRQRSKSAKVRFGATATAVARRNYTKRTDGTTSRQAARRNQARQAKAFNMCALRGIQAQMRIA